MFNLIKKYQTTYNDKYQQLYTLIKQQVQVVLEEMGKDFSQFLFDQKFSRKYQGANIIYLDYALMLHEVAWLNKEDELLEEYKKIKNQSNINPTKSLKLVLDFIF